MVFQSTKAGILYSVTNYALPYSITLLKQACFIPAVTVPTVLNHYGIRMALTLIKTLITTSENRLILNIHSKKTIQPIGFKFILFSILGEL